MNFFPFIFHYYKPKIWIKYELEFTYDIEKPKTYLNKIEAIPILYILMMISIILVFLSFMRFLIWKKFIDMTTELGYELTLTGTILMIFHNILLFCHPTPLFIGRRIEVFNTAVNANIYYYVNDIFYTLQIYKVLIVIKAFLTNSRFMTSRANRVW